MIRSISRTAASLLLIAGAAVASQASAAPAASLDQLLEQTRNARAAEAKENQARIAEFQRERDQQARMLAEANAVLAQQQARSNQLSAAFDANEKKLTELQAALDLKVGNLGEMFGVVRQVAGDFASVAVGSMISERYPDRVDFAQKLAQTKSLASIADLETFWYEMQREMTETGQTVKYTTKVVSPDGQPSEQEVVRVGSFTAISDGEFLNYLPSIKSFTVFTRQPDGKFTSIAADFEDETEGYNEMVIDPTRGVLLGLFVQRPTWVERISHGEAVGYVIILVGVIGAILAIWQFLYLLKVGAAVRRQLKDTSRPVTDNPLGRVLATFKGDGSRIEEDAEIVELRISEAVLREVPILERFQSFLRLAVAAGPLLGLVGTVIGMIITFQAITESGSGDPKLMAAGISAAMIATVLGLGIAVPLLFMNAALTARSRAIIQILDEQSAGMLAESLEAKRRA
jgi:biopolymer transport protein ExbB